MNSRNCECPILNTKPSEWTLYRSSSIPLIILTKRWAQTITVLPAVFRSVVFRASLQRSQLRRFLILSVQIEPSANSATGVCSNSEPLSLAALVEALKTQTAPPSLEQLNAWLENAKVSNDELKPYVAFKAGNYSRHRVFRNDWAEMLILCWQPGQRTPIHDHNGSRGAVLVQKGVVWETTFSFDEEKGLSIQLRSRIPVWCGDQRRRS